MISRLGAVIPVHGPLEPVMSVMEQFDHSATSTLRATGFSSIAEPSSALSL